LNKQKRETEASVSLFCRNLKFDLVLRLFHGAGTDAAQTGERGDDDGRGRADGEKGNADAESERKCEQNEDPDEQDAGQRTADKTAFFMTAGGKISCEQRRYKKRAERERRREFIRIVEGKSQKTGCEKKQKPDGECDQCARKDGNEEALFLFVPCAASI